MDRKYPLVNPRLPRFLYGGDYNPEQWPPKVWPEDARLMKQAGVNVATVGVFSWTQLQPAPDRFEFDWLDQVMDLLARNAIFACLATATAAQPAWLSHLHPDVLPVDYRGRRRRHGERGNFCANSRAFREACATLVTRLAERYRNHPALLMWHVGNEYGGRCFCETCATAFRNWLKARYGSLDELNRRWYTAVWNHTYTDWLQIEPPGEFGEGSMPALTLDYARFADESLLGCYLNEARILRELTPGIPITTNMMGTFYGADYRRWAPHVDVVSWDCYPNLRDDPAMTAFAHDLMCGLKGDRPFLLMEQTPSNQNWQFVSALKRPGQMRLWSWQAVAHGADSVMFFQWRRSRGGPEKLHGAIIDHAGHERTRVYREVAALGAELAAFKDAVLGSAPDAQVALVFDWENWWALDNAMGLVNPKRYRETVLKHYRALWSRNVPVAVIGTDADLSPYRVLIAPLLFMVRQEWVRKVEEFVARGGRFITTCLSGWMDETDLAHLGGYPGPLRKVTGVWVEEVDAIYEDQQNRIIIKQSFGPCRGTYACKRLCDLMHCETATVLAIFGDDFYAGWPAVAENAFGEGFAYYIGTDPEPDFLLHFYRTICADAGLSPVLEAPEGVEVRRRVQNDRRFIFALNHKEDVARLDLPEGKYRDLQTGQPASGSVPLQGYGVLVLEETT